MQWTDWLSSISRGRACLCLATLFLCLLLQSDALCQAQPLSDERDAKEMVAEFRAALHKGDVSQADAIGRRLQALGDAALAAIRQALPESSESETRQFIRILAGIGGSQATRILVELACDPFNATIAAQALHAIGNRPIDFALTDDQVQFLLAQIREGDVINAAAAAGLLSRCQNNDTGLITHVVLARYCKELVDPQELAPVTGSYVSPRVYVLNLFLVAFGNLDDKGITVTKAAAENTRKWLTLALGMCGDPSVAPEIETLIKKDPDPYLRTVAVRAYARSAGQKAVPLLKTLLADKTESEYDRLPDGSPVYPIRLAAQDELTRLEHSSKNH